MVCAIGGLQKSGKSTCSGDTFQGYWLLLILMIVSTQKYGKCEKCIADVHISQLAVHQPVIFSHQSVIKIQNCILKLHFNIATNFIKTQIVLNSKFRI